MSKAFRNATLTLNDRYSCSSPRTVALTKAGMFIWDFSRRLDVRYRCAQCSCLMKIKMQGSPQAFVNNLPSRNQLRKWWLLSWRRMPLVNTLQTM